jgi:phage I-like protein
MKKIVKLSSVELAADLARGAKPVWIQIAKQGEFRGHSAVPHFALNAEVFTEIVANFKATKNKRVPIDFEHASEADPASGEIPTRGAPAQGWIVDLAIRDGNLWGLVEWGDLAREYIKSGQYRFLSPAIRFGAKDPVTGKKIGAVLSSAAITNQPFLDGMQPLAAKNTAPKAATKALLKDALARNDSLQTQVEKLAELAAEVPALKKENEDLRAQLASHAEADIRARIDHAISRGKHGEDAREYLLSVARSQPEAFRALYSLPKTSAREPVEVPAYLSQQIAAGRNGEQLPTTVQTPDAPPTMLRTEAEVPSMREMVSKYQAKGMTLEDAVLKAHNKIAKKVATLSRRA